MQQGYTAPGGTQADYMRWDQDANCYTDPAPAFNMNDFGANTAMAQAQYDQSVGAHSTQLARRPMNRQLVSTTQHMTHDGLSDQWVGQYGDDTLLDQQGTNGLIEENDNIELLEERAAVAKREAQAKRKQIPPFVQKLSR
jgi:heat shock transcription factor